MFRTCWLIAAIMVSLVMPAWHGSAAEPALSPVVIPGAEQFDLRSKAGLDYRIFVAAPQGEPPAGGFPIIYLTDANANFPVMLFALRRRVMGEAQAIVVGIGYPSEQRGVQSERRSFDLTPEASAAWLKTLPPGGPPIGRTGGNDAFLEFIEGEVKPMIERKFIVNRQQQALFGHSFGGLFALHVLFNKPECFQTYLVSSPSIWWNGRSVLEEETAFTRRVASQSVNARLLLMVGEWEETPGPGVTDQRAAMLKQRAMRTNAKELVDRLSQARIEGFSVAFRELPEEDHGSAVLPAASRGARFFLEN